VWCDRTGQGGAYVRDPGITQRGILYLWDLHADVFVLTSTTGTFALD
jgi:hypothetical protein